MKNMKVLVDSSGNEIYPISSLDAAILKKDKLFKVRIDYVPEHLCDMITFYSKTKHISFYTEDL